jgi:hypothetical protein
MAAEPAANGAEIISIAATIRAEFSGLKRQVRNAA